MSALPTPAHETSPDFDADAKIYELRHQLFEAASEVKELPSRADLATRLRSIAHQIHEVEDDLLLVAHVVDLESSGFEEDLQAIDDRLADGWVPPSRPVEDIAAELRAKYGQ